jgi:hydrogenase maturation protein HypF
MDRRLIAVSGIVQGVGFRPFVHGLAERLGLHGFVQNQSGAVRIEVEGESSLLDRFLSELTSLPPPLARIDEVRWSRRPLQGDGLFRIAASDGDGVSPIFISPDVATCDACLAELFDFEDRRYRYPFLNCTHCGPRLTIVTGSPYDRERTTMSGFAMCARCRAEYDDPRDRRFHAQPIACPACGPQLRLLDALGRPQENSGPLRAAATALRSGKIGAIKGLGGYHLACRADDEAAVRELRRRKQRDEKPFALMVRDRAAAARLCLMSETEAALLESPARPIVLLGKRPEVKVARSVAPGNPALGIMLPYTPLHHLLLSELEEISLVLTSGNRSDEPIAYQDDDAINQLAGIADFFLTHDRPIHIRCDDSVTRVVDGVELPLRRSRGQAPLPLTLPRECRQPVLALGGQLKATFALGRGRHAFLSHHLGDLDEFTAYRAYVEAIAHYERLFDLRAERIVHDLHPDYGSTLWARQHADGRPVLAVQHHHAHMASCMAEHGLNEPVIGVTFDGTGFGLDGTVWGGEFLTGDYRHFQRAAHLRQVPLPGGEQAIRQPWRVAAAYLLDAGEDLGLLEGRAGPEALATVQRMIARGLNAPRSSSAGRLFDAVAALIGIRSEVSFEGQAAMELEWLATAGCADGTYPWDMAERADPSGASCREVDVRPLIAAIAADVRRGVPPNAIARRFHATLAMLVARVCGSICDETGLGKVVLSGGVFMNVLLLRETTARLAAEGFQVYRHRRVPPNDGGLSLGQLAIAAAHEE